VRRILPNPLDDLRAGHLAGVAACNQQVEGVVLHAQQQRLRGSE
jgi:hypothetical protein